MRFGNRYTAILRLTVGLTLLLSWGFISHAQTWQRLGPDGGNVISLAAGPDGSLFLGTSDGHIYASQDAAAHWALRGRAGARLDGVIQELVVDAHEPQRIFAALWFQNPRAGGGIFRSEDGARSWKSSGLQDEAVRTLEQSRSQPEIFIAGTRTGIFRSKDTGLTWERISPSGDQELKNIDSLAIDPTDPRIIYVGTYHLPWKTTDGGKTWAAINAGMIDDSDVMSLLIDSANPARVFASACSGIYRSDTAGAAWTKLQGIPYSSRRTQSIAQDPRDPRILYAGTTEGLWLTRDSGETWSRATPRDLVVNSVTPLTSEQSPTKIILGTEVQGILVSRDSAANFFLSNTGFSHRVVAELVGDPRDPMKMLARFAGTGASLLETRDAGTSWQPLSGDEPAGGIEKVFATASGWWASLLVGGAARYDDTSSKWQPLQFLPAAAPRSRQHPATRSIKPASSPPPTDPHVFDIQVSGTQIFVAATDGRWSGELTKMLLRRAPASGLNEILRSIEVLPGASELWAIANDKVLHSNDAGKTWSNEIPSPSLATLLWVRLLPSNEGLSLLLGTQSGVYRRSLETNSAWQLLQSGLPAAATHPPLIDAQLIAIAVNNGGLFLSRDLGETWQRLDTPLDEGIFTGMAGDTRGGLIVGSQSEGILHWMAGSSNK